jgi:hypothetical protein
VSVTLRNALLAALNLPGIALVAIGASLTYIAPTDSCSGYEPPLWSTGNTLARIGCVLTALALLTDLVLLVARAVGGRAGGIAVSACLATYVFVGLWILSSISLCL